MTTISFPDWASREAARDFVHACWLEDRALRARADWQAGQGWCVLCASRQPMTLPAAASGAEPNLREALHCGRCRLNSRVRGAIGLMLGEFAPGPDSRIYVTEQTTPTFVWMQRHLAGTVLGSEFERDPARRLDLAEYLRSIGGCGAVAFQDVTALDFADASLDAVLSLDVLEHVPDYGRALSEFARVLRRGGVLVATFPFLDARDTLVRARLAADGGIEHLLEPEYHGDPISGGVLCYHHFGWDLLDACRRVGFRDVRMVMPWRPEAGMYYGLWTLVATR